MLLKACAILGDESHLAAKLGVPVAEIVDWLVSDRPVPVDVFLMAVDIVLAHSKKQVEDTRALLQDIRMRHEPRLLAKSRR